MELMEGLLSRRSVRKYQDKAISKDVLEQIIKAGQYAPSAHNTQPWEFLVVEDKEALKHFRVMQRSALFAENAAAVIIVCGGTLELYRHRLFSRYGEYFVGSSCLGVRSLLVRHIPDDRPDFSG